MLGVLHGGLRELMLGTVIRRRRLSTHRGNRDPGAARAAQIPVGGELDLV
jgi:hypothetical protein